MDLGVILWAGITATGTVGFGAHCWLTRRRPTPIIEDQPSRTVTVVPKIVHGVGDGSEASRGLLGAAPAAPCTSSLAVNAWASIAGGAEWEAKLATAERRIRQSPLFGDNAIRRRGADPMIVAAVESYLSHPSQQAPTS